VAKPLAARRLSQEIAGNKVPRNQVYRTEGAIWARTARGRCPAAVKRDEAGTVRLRQHLQLGGVQGARGRCAEGVRGLHTRDPADLDISLIEVPGADLG